MKIFLFTFRSVLLERARLRAEGIGIVGGDGERERRIPLRLFRPSRETLRARVGVAVAVAERRVEILFFG